MYVRLRCLIFDYFRNTLKCALELRVSWRNFAGQIDALNFANEGSGVAGSQLDGITFAVLAVIHFLIDNDAPFNYRNSRARCATGTG